MQVHLEYLVLLLFALIILYIVVTLRKRKRRLGILAYGSLIDEPGEEIEATIVDRKEVLTPFNVEFARSSQTRNGAPTLVPVRNGGAKVKAVILVLEKSVSEKHAIDMLWRRERNVVGSNQKYDPPTQANENTVLVRHLEKFQNVDVVLYTEIAPNITPLTPRRLAQLAVDSARSEAGGKGRDGISYLITAKKNGIRTPLMPKYEKEILRSAGATNLEEVVYLIQTKNTNSFVI